MNSLTHNRWIGVQSAASRPSPFASVRLIRALARFVDSHGWIVFTAVSSACAWLRLRTFDSRHLDHDELYSYYIAQAPTLKQLLLLTRTVDLHPPLSYLLIRISFALFGVSSWSCRLPSVIAILCTAALVFWMARRIFTSLYGIIAVLVFWSVPFTYQADEARPYSLLLCFTALMLASWYRATEVRDTGATSRRWALLTMAVAGFGLLLSHVLGVLPYAAFFGAELVRLRIRRKPDWSLWIALLAPAISVLTYLPLFRSHAAILFTEQYRVTPMRIVNCYLRSITFLVIPLLVAALIAFLWPKQPQGRSQQESETTRLGSRWAALAPLTFLLGSLYLVPVAVAIIFAHTGTAFFDRYAFVAIIPISLTPALVLGLRTQRNQMAALAVALVLGAVLVLNTTGKPWLIEQLANLAPPRVAAFALNAFAAPPIVTEPVVPMVPERLQAALAAAPVVSDLDAIDPDLPLVANTGLTFLEIDQEADAELTARLYLLNDRQAATAIAHDTVFENYDRVKRVFPIRGQVAPYCAFIGEHPRFLALGAYNHPQGWLLKKLDRDGANLHLIGVYRGITEEAQLYEVTVLKATCPARP
ncbi:MAG: glycosyltransferase family 39 protein [Terriglobales bacterium]|jgi:hypothetical protein